MALLNNLYIHVTDESVDSTVESTTHPTEKGIEISDTIRRKPLTLSLTGMIVDYGDEKAPAILAKVMELQRYGSLINYRGRNVINNLQIQSFNRSHPNTIHGGLSFTMELKEVRIVQTSYNAEQNQQKKAEEEENKKNPVLEVGSTVNFKGGYVYESSDAKNPKGGKRSSCEVTILKINNAAWATHPYCVQATSRSGKILQGWVDKATLEGALGVNTNKESKSSNQQVQTETPQKLKASYTVKAGDTVYSICNQYATTFGVPGKNRSIFYDEFMAVNKDAFSEAGNPRTLKTGARVTIEKGFYTDKLTQSNY